MPTCSDDATHGTRSGRRWFSRPGRRALTVGAAGLALSLLASPTASATATAPTTETAATRSADAGDVFAPGVGSTTIWDSSTPLTDSLGQSAPGLLGGPKSQGVGEVEFGGSGDAFVSEKRGRIVYFPGASTDQGVVLTERDGSDLSEDTLAVQDTGLGGIAVDPMWPRRPYLYAIYTSNEKRAEQGGGRWSAQECGPAYNCITSGTLERLTIKTRKVGGQRLPYIAHRRELIADEWCQTADTHSVGDLTFGPDGQLYVSAGDGTPNGREREPQKSLCGSDSELPVRMRALDVLDADEKVSLNGKILRLDPRTGRGSYDNPEGSSADPNRARVVATGFRNPYRMAFRPGTSTLAVSMVGGSRHEAVYEIDDLTAGAAANNAGWPCQEVLVPKDEHASCAELAPVESLMTPTATWAHDAPLTDEPCGVSGSTAAMGVAYVGSRAPAEYRDELVFGDYGRGCLWRMDDGEPTFVASFPRHTARDLTTGPGGQIYFTDYQQGAVRRLDLEGFTADEASSTSGNGRGKGWKSRRSTEQGSTRQSSNRGRWSRESSWTSRSTRHSSSSPAGSGRGRWR